jgi:hypothetical protein
MTTVQDLHPKAMDLADEAFRLQRTGRTREAQPLFKQALDLEREAALLLPATQESEPSRAILFRSAAALAYNAEDYEEAERLIAYGLSGFPPSEIKEELKNLYEDINFKRHLQVSGIVLSENQWLMSIYGNVTSFGQPYAFDLIRDVVWTKEGLCIKTDIDRLIPSTDIDRLIPSW